MIHIHKYKELKTQRTKDIIDSHSGSPFLRIVKECRCGKQKMIPLILGTPESLMKDDNSWIDD